MSFLLHHGDPKDMFNNLRATKILKFSIHCQHSSSLSQPWGETGGKLGSLIPSNVQVAGNKCSDSFYKMAMVGSLGWDCLSQTVCKHCHLHPKHFWVAKLMDFNDRQWGTRIFSSKGHNHLLLLF